MQYMTEDDGAGGRLPVLAAGLVSTVSRSRTHRNRLLFWVERVGLRPGLIVFEGCAPDANVTTSKGG
jgi:hypothetical protein